LLVEHRTITLPSWLPWRSTEITKLVLALTCNVIATWTFLNHVFAILALLHTSTFHILYCLCFVLLANVCRLKLDTSHTFMIFDFAIKTMTLLTFEAFKFSYTFIFSPINCSTISCRTVNQLSTRWFQRSTQR